MFLIDQFAISISHVAFAIAVALLFITTTVMAHVLRWNSHQYKHTQDLLVVIIGCGGWGICVRSIVQNGFLFSNTLALIGFSAITTLHVLRAIYGDHLC